MKRLFKKNQVVLTLLAVMIAVAGYLNYINKDNVTDADSKTETSAAQAADGLLDISDDDILAENSSAGSQTSGTETYASNEEDAANATGDTSDILSLDNDPDEETTAAAENAGDASPGEAILTNNTSNVSEFVAAVQLSREQLRAKSKETYLEVINNEALSEELKQDAINGLLALTEISEKENAAETLLSAKGFTNSVVTIVDGEADVVIAKTSITDAERAQIEDIVKRKCELTADKIVISLME